MHPEMLKIRSNNPTLEVASMVKTALFETLIESAVPNDEGGYTFTLEGLTYKIKDTLEITRIAQDHDYIIIYLSMVVPKQHATWRRCRACDHFGVRMVLNTFRKQQPALEPRVDQSFSRQASPPLIVQQPRHRASTYSRLPNVPPFPPLP